MIRLLFILSALCGASTISSMTYVTKRNSSNTDFAIECFISERHKVGHITFHTNDHCKNAIIRRIYVEPNYRNQGVESQLLHASFKQLQSLKISTVEVEAVDSKHFFLKHGAIQADANTVQLLTDTVPLIFYLDTSASSAHKDAL